MRDMITVLVFVLVLTGAGIGAYAGLIGINAWRRRIQGGDPGELDALHERIAGVEALEHRIVELEERVEFAERMLAQKTEPDALPIRSTVDRLQ